MATYILYIWMVTAAAGSGGSFQHHAWVPSGEYKASGALLEASPPTVARAQKLCHDAIRELGLDPAKARCVRSQ